MTFLDKILIMNSLLNSMSKLLEDSLEKLSTIAVICIEYIWSSIWISIKFPIGFSSLKYFSYMLFVSTIELGLDEQLFVFPYKVFVLKILKKLLEVDSGSGILINSLLNLRWTSK